MNTLEYDYESLQLPEALPYTLVQACLDVNMWLTNHDFFLCSYVSDITDCDGDMIDGLTNYVHFSVQYSKKMWHVSVVNLEHRISCTRVCYE